MSQMTIALIILVATVVLFIWEPWPIIVTAIGASIVFAYTGIITVNDIFTGYNSTTIVLLAGMMVIGSSLFHAGITDLIGEKMVKITGKSERNIILATLVVSCALSSVCSNIGVMTAMAPLVTAMCIAAGIGPSKALLSLLFGAQFGGFVTLVGVGCHCQQCNGGARDHALWLFQHHPLWCRCVYFGNFVFYFDWTQTDSGYQVYPRVCQDGKKASGPEKGGHLCGHFAVCPCGHCSQPG